MAQQQQRTNNEDLLLVTGANGFMASWIVSYALEKGLRVRGTVRDTKDESRCKHLRNLPGAKERLELVNLTMDKSSQEEFNKALQGVTLLAHTASPLPVKCNKNDQALIPPAVEGTKKVMRAAIATPTMRQMVMTASVVTIGENITMGVGEGTHERGEKDWTDPSNADSYPKSKTLAEQTAREIYDQAKPKFSFCTIHPSLILGPVLGDILSTTPQVLARYLNGYMPLAPHVGVGIVDVRNVAQAHLQALSLPPEQVNGRRFVLHNETKWSKEMAELLGETFEPMGYKMPKHEMPYSAMWVMAWFDELTNQFVAGYGSYPIFDNKPSKDILRIQYIPLKKTLADTGHSLVYHGHSRKLPGYKPPREGWTPLDAR
jgi:nucleoside-diphosphate-sugar epimerase